MNIRTFALAALVIAGAAGAATPATAQSAPPDGVRRDAHIVFAEDIRLSGGRSIFDGLRLLGPRVSMGCPSNRLVGSPSVRPVVYLDGVRLQSADVLRSMHYAELDSLAFVSRLEANMLLGPKHPCGALLVATRKG